MNTDTFFKNKFTLELNNKKSEDFFNRFLNKERLKHNMWLIGLLLLFNVADVIFVNVISHKFQIVFYNKFFYLYYTSHIMIGISFVLFILSFILKNSFFQIFLTYCIYTLFTFPMVNIRVLLDVYFDVDDTIYSLFCTLEILIRMICLVLLLVTFPHGFYMNIILIILVIIYESLIEKYYSIFFYFFEIIVEIFISYFYTKNTKETFQTNLILKNQIIWYDNLFDHMNSAFISLNSNNKIKILNNALLENLSKNKEIIRILESRQENYLPTNEENFNILNRELTILNTRKNSADESRNLNINILKINSNKVMKILLSDVYYQVGESDPSGDITDFNLKEFLTKIKNLYTVKQSEERFEFLGYKDLEIEWPKDSQERSNKNIITFEIFYRCRNIEVSTEEDEFEFIFNDVSHVKKKEEEKAELKYKTMFLSKFAHEFKNPIICITELIEDFDEKYSKQLEELNNSEFKESYKNFKKIKNFSEYLLDLLQDFDYYSKIQTEKEIPINSETVELDEIFYSCRSAADILLLKYKKQNDVDFVIENNLNDKEVLITDGVKLKQVLINLISNAIKFTNKGLIKLKIDKIEDEFNQNTIKFEVIDTGIGMKEDQKENFVKPFKMSADVKYGSGLGLYIVSKILENMKSAMEIKSQIGQGTNISFNLNCDIKLNDDVEEVPRKKTLVVDKQLPIDKNERSMISLIEANDEHKKNENYEINFVRNVPVNVQNDPDKNVENVLNVIDKINESKFNPEISYYIFVDDEQFTLKSSIRVFKKAAENLKKKIEVFEVEDGIECLYMIYRLIKKGFKISCIVSDELMNYLNGTQTAEVMKKIKNLNLDQIPFFLLTAYPDIRSIFINKMFSKPFNIKDAESILNHEF